MASVTDGRDRTPGQKSAVGAYTSPTPKQMDLAARSIDLVSTIAKSAGAVGQIVQDIIAWRSREGIDEAQLTYTLSLAKDFSYPNDNGGGILSTLKLKADRLYALKLIVPGAIGRYIIIDKSLCWLATTHAVLFRYHDLEASAETLCNLTLSRQVTEDDNRRIVYLARIRPVLDQVTESIAIHTSNIDIGVAPLPDELRALKPHFLAPWAFASSVHAITQSAGQELLVRVDHCVTDLLDWIYNHWDGELQVTVETSVIYRRQLGHKARRLIFLVGKPCADDQDCSDPEHVGSVSVSVFLTGHMAGSPNRPFYTGTTDPAAGQQKHGYRTELYSIAFRASRLVRLGEREIIMVKQSAQDVVRSMMHMRVKANVPSTTRLELHASLDSTGEQLRWWVRRSPAILQPNYGSVAKPRQLFHQDSEAEEDIEMDDETHSDSERSIADGFHLHASQSGAYTLADLLRDYPEIDQIVQNVRDRCHCGCRDQGPLEDIDNENCLQALAATQTLLLISHATVDSMGISDLSTLNGQNGPRNMIDAMIDILADIATRGCISWRHWFKLAASAVTGMDYDTIDEVATIDAGGELVAWTCGSLTVVPTWFNLEEKIDLQRSWGVKVLHGKPATLMAECAVFETQMTTAANSEGAQERQDDYVEDQDPGSAVPVNVLSSVIASKQALHRLMTLIRTPSSIRILDPTSVYQGLMHAVVPTCNHRSRRAKGVVRTIDEVICYWNDWGPGTADSIEPIQIFLSGEDNLKMNIAIALSKGRAVLQRADRCCLRCAVREAQRLRYRCVSLRASQREQRLIASAPAT